jgi:Xaa-Pro dipeptidase
MQRRRFVAGLGALGVGGSLLGCRRAQCSETTNPVAVHTVETAPIITPVASSDPFAELAGFCAGAVAIETAEYEARITRVRAELAQLGQAALIVEAGVDMLYLGGPRWGLSERPLLLIIPRDADPLLVGPAFERGTLEARQGPLVFAVATWDEHESPYALVEARLIAAKLAKKARVAIGSSTRGFVIDGLREAGPRRAYDSRAGALERCRRCKSPAELALLRRANEATKAAIAAASTHVEPGMHEHELAEILRAAQLAAGLSDPWVLALFGPNAAYPHGTPEGRQLADGDLILIDTGGFLHGYASDITRTWAFPEPAAIDAERRRAWEVVREAQAAAIATIRPGVRCADVDAAARSVVAAAGFDRDYEHFSHRLGHGIGMQVHEPPYLVRDAAHVLEIGNTMSDEPGLYLPGAWGIRLEDIVAVTDGGAEVFGPLAGSLDTPFGALTTGS